MRMKEVRRPLGASNICTDPRLPEEALKRKFLSEALASVQASGPREILSGQYPAHRSVITHSNIGQILD